MLFFYLHPPHKTIYLSSSIIVHIILDSKKKALRLPSYQLPHHSILSLKPSATDIGKSQSFLFPFLHLQELSHLHRYLGGNQLCIGVCILLYTNPLLLQNTICSKAYKFKKRFCTIYTLSACCLLTCYLKHSSGSKFRFSKEKLLFYLPTLRLRVRVLFRFRYVFENVWSPAKVTKIVRKSFLSGTILGSNWCRHSSKDLKLNLQKSVNPIYAHFYDLLLRMYMNDCAAGCAKSGSTCYRKRDVLFDMTLL